MEKPFPCYRGDDPYIFVSYAHADSALVFPEIELLRNQGFNVWYDEGIEPGSTWREEVALALTQSSLLLYFVTPGSVKSESCHQELNFALSRERKILAVHLLDADLSIGIELSLSNKQAIIKADHSESAYQEKLISSVRNLMPKIEPISLDLATDITTTQQDRKSIAIIPFNNRSSDAENQYLCDGIAEELISGLATVDGLSVASQLSSFVLKGQTLSSQVIGDKLGVENVLTGSVQKSGNRVRITVALTNTDSDEVVWSEKYDGTLDDIFELQENVANNVVAALQSKLVGVKSGPIIDTGTMSTAAYDYFLKGTHQFWRQTRYSFQEADHLLREATKTDPNFGRAWWYIYILNWISSRMFDYLPETEFQSRGQEALGKMKDINYQAPFSYQWMEWQLDPESAPGPKEQASILIDVIKGRVEDWRGSEYMLLGDCLSDAGLLSGCAQYFKYHEDHFASSILDTNQLSLHGNVLFALGRFDKCIEQLSRAMVLQPDAPLIVGTRAMAYSRTGQFQKAAEDLKELSKTFPRNFAQFYDLYWRREMDAAREAYNWLSSRRNLANIFKVWAHFLMGNIDAGLDALEENDPPVNASGLRYGYLFPMTPSILEEVTNHPRYQQLLANTGLDNAWRDELLERVNELEPITGIRVELDQSY